MPQLTADDLKAMRNTPNQTCPECSRKLKKNYCRDCRQFFWQGHLSDCSRLAQHDGGETDDHRGHRTY